MEGKEKRTVASQSIAVFINRKLVECMQNVQIGAVIKILILNDTRCQQKDVKKKRRKRSSAASLTFCK